MRLNSLHNGLYVAARLLRADMLAVKLLPESHIDWSHADVVVGETSRLPEFGWPDGARPPTLEGASHRQQNLFGIEGALDLYVLPEQRGFAACVRITDALLEALPGQFLIHDRRDTSRLALGQIWFAAVLAESSDAIALLDADADSSTIELVTGVCAQALWGLHRSNMLHLDRLTGLPGAAELRHRLQLSVATLQMAARDPALADAEHACSLLALVEIDDFPLLRRTLGTTRSTELLKDMGAALTGALRKNDGTFRYRDATFAVAADIAQGAEDQLLQKLRAAWDALAMQHDLHGVTLSIASGTIGRMEAQESQNLTATTLLTAAENALQRARARGGNTHEIALPAAQDAYDDDAGETRLFTNEPLKDYRNSRVLWQATRLLNAETTVDALARGVCQLLRDHLTVAATDLYLLQGDAFRSLLNAHTEVRTAELTELLAHCCRSAQTQQIPQSTNRGSERRWVALPLRSRKQTLGAVLLTADAPFDDEDLQFMQALIDQIAAGIDRLQLAEREAQRGAQETESLRAELQELREHAKPAAELITKSPAMQSVMAYVEKIAPTDASVLIMGESGAGKEVMAQAIVNASQRAHAPLITVDCSAIAHSLIDSELFGRVKGAFTGADDASPGRIAEAHGGTLFLDEIGELPLDVQAKLLRFVQEKELIAVGDTRRRRIDTRIICATNRDLLFESSQGRFRADLYYRLQVLQVTIPPLRERGADIPVLAETFLARYSEQFGRPLQGFSDDAWRRITEYHWPGNVRELQNAIVRATLTAEGEYIEGHDLQFGEELPVPSISVPLGAPAGGQSTADAAKRGFAPESQALRAPPTAPIDHSATSQPTPAPESVEDTWHTLSSLLAGQVAALINEARLDAPLGRWLADTVVLTAADVSSGVARQAARILGVPETTLRRQLSKARQNEDNPFQLMSRQWSTSLPALNDLLRTLMLAIAADPTIEPEFADRCQALLLQQVANHIGNDRRAGAALMGITPPTYTRWLARYEIEAQPIVPPETQFKLEKKFQ